ncbi:MAG: carboxypeptidase M32 [Atopobiaceae bacterium]|nr:carboxypeptidase M32 [Atopobiaceae bacterium]
MEELDELRPENETTACDVAADEAALDALERHLFALNYARVVIDLNGDTVDPPQAAEGRAEAISILEEDYNRLLCSPETGALLARLSKAELSEPHASQVRVLTRDREKQMNVPVEEQAILTKLIVEGTNAWRKAKLANDWDSFEPILDRVFDAKKRVALARRPDLDPYDEMLDEWEPFTSRETYDVFFDTVKETVVPLVGEIVARGWQPSIDCVSGHFDREGQLALGRDLVRLIQTDKDALFIAETEHPFEGSPTSSLSMIACHVYEDRVISNLFTMLHEGGHSLYDTGVNRAYDYTCLTSGTSSGMHESQSRFFENMVGRNEALAPTLVALLEKHFPGRFADVDPHDFYLATNRAEPSLVRTEADELTYPLHIIVRYEIERMLVAGEASAKDVPGLWAQKMRDYLGVEVPDHTRGALQDMHWGNGLIGYFPSYALGSAYAAQFKAAMVAGGMDFDGILASAELSPIVEWLRERVWVFGRSKDCDEILRAATGSSFDPSYYTAYLKDKFSRIYGLDS